MTQEAQLKACPFCGGEAEIDEIEGGIGALFFASCKDGDCCGYHIDPWVKYARRIEAATAWNTRIESGVVAEALLAVVNATRAYWPPDGISEQECINRILEAIDNPKINPVIAAWEASK